MKKALFTLILFLLVCNSSLQAQALHDSFSKADREALAAIHLKKAKNKRTVAVVLLGGGVALGLLGMGQAMSNLQYVFYPTGSSGQNKSKKGIELLGAGVIAIGGSIPFLISSFHHKRKAKLLLQNQSTFLTPKFSLQQTTVGISIPL